SEDLAFDAQQLRQAPAVFAAFASIERLVDGQARVGRLPGSRHTMGQRAEVYGVAKAEPGLESGPEKRQSGNVASRQEQRSLQTTAQRPPHGQGMLRRMLEERRHEPLCRRQIANVQSNWTSRVGQNIAQGQRMIGRSGPIESALSTANRLIRKSLHP